MSSFSAKSYSVYRKNTEQMTSRIFANFPEIIAYPKSSLFLFQMHRTFHGSGMQNFWYFFFRKIKRNDDDDDDGDDVVQSSWECWRRFYISKQPKKVAWLLSIIFALTAKIPLKLAICGETYKTVVKLYRSNVITRT